MLFKSKEKEQVAQHNDASSNNLLHVYYEGKMMRGLQVLDSSKTSQVYKIDIKQHLFKMPKLAIYSAASGDLISTVEYKSMKKRITLNYCGNEVILNAPGFWGLDYKYASPTLNGQQMTWQHQKKLDELNMALLDANAMPVARFLPSNWAMKKGGKIEILDSAINSQQAQALMDEIVVTALAVMVYRHVQRQQAGAASASSSSSAAAAAAAAA
jgi:hypothetical protein